MRWLQGVSSRPNFLSARRVRRADAGKRANRPPTPAHDFRHLNHDLRASLAGVLGLTDDLVRSATCDSQLHKLRAVHSAAEDMVATLDRYLGADVEPSERAWGVAPFAPNQLIADIVALATPSALAKGLTLSLQQDVACPARLCGDRSMAREIVTNLLTNAIKYSDHGTITVSTRSQTVATDSLWQVIVQDQGPGIPPAAHEAIFREAYRLPSTEGHDGAGLGLAIARQLARAMGGDITVTSSDGCGATFTFAVRLPLQDASQATATQAAGTDDKTVQAQQNRACHMRVLAVDDSATNRMILANMLRALSVNVSTAASGAEALAILQQQPHDLVLMDLNMPDMDGFATTGAIRSLEHRLGDTRTPIVAVTANALRGERDRCLAADMDDYISKPIRQARIEAIIEVWRGVKQNPTQRPDTTYRGPERRKSSALSDMNARNTQDGAFRRRGTANAEAQKFEAPPA